MMLPITESDYRNKVAELTIIDTANATIRQISTLAMALEKTSGEKFIHLELGNPGLPASQSGVRAEIAALEGGIANKYPSISGLPSLKENGSKFVKAFIDVDINPKGIIPTVGSMQGSFTIMLLLGQRVPGKDTILFIDPGFPAQRTQAKILGLKDASFDIYNYRGKKLEAKLESELSRGTVTAIIYSNPNNPAWTNLTDEELEIIRRLATKYDAVVIEDMAYMTMDFRSNYGVPCEPPYVPTIAKYTDNYILLVSASKIFSYAGQRVALVCISDEVYKRKYPYLEKFYNMASFGDAYIFGVLYAASSGTSHSAQYAMSAMLEDAVAGKLHFAEECREYERRCVIVKKAFRDAGFHIVYAKDGDAEIGDGFFFTVGYGDMSAGELHKELLRYGVATIALPSTGSRQPGVRVCVSAISSSEEFEQLAIRLKRFENDHS